MRSYQTFRFDGYDFDSQSGRLTMRYSYVDGPSFEEVATLPVNSEIQPNEAALSRVLDYLFIVAGTSYYKAYVSPEIDVGGLQLSDADAALFNNLYRQGLSQHLYENKIDPNAVATFHATNSATEAATLAKSEASGIMLMLSGGKDSILSAELLRAGGHDYSIFHVSSTGSYPQLIDTFDKNVFVVQRQVDVPSLARLDGAYNGHVPFSAILAGYALASAVLQGENIVLAANESSADEANVVVDGFNVNHQYSKTWEYEQMLQAYLDRNAPGLHYASHLRRFNELQIAEKFVARCWDVYGSLFSSCNTANYKQGSDVSELKWCGRCSKCANAWLLFAPFVEREELEQLFQGKNLSKDPKLRETFRQLMGLSDIKPFECVGTFDELREAYALAVERDNGYRIDTIEPEVVQHQEAATMNEQQIVKALYES